MGQEMANYFGAANEVVILTRAITSVKTNAFGQHNIDNTKNIRLVQWDGVTPGEWIKEVDGADLLINLAGKTVNCRYTQKNKKEILNSRINAAALAADAPALMIACGLAMRSFD